MKTGADLEPEFRKTLSRFTDDENIVTSLWQDVLNHYTEPLRHYHSLVHLNNIVTILCQVKNEIHDWDILILAIAYHDIIYNVYKSDNEEKSAAYACKILSGLLSKEKQELLSRHIIATKRTAGTATRILTILQMLIFLFSEHRRMNIFYTQSKSAKNTKYTRHLCISREE